MLSQRGQAVEDYLRVDAQAAHGVAEGQAGIVLQASLLGCRDTRLRAALAGCAAGGHLGSALYLDGALEVTLDLGDGPGQAQCND